MRRQLVVLTGATTLLVLVAFLVPLGLLLRREAESRAVTVATLRAQGLAPLVVLDAERAPLRPGMTLFLPDGRVRGVPGSRTEAVELAALGQAFVARTGDGMDVLVPVTGLPEGTAVIRVHIPPERLHEGVGGTWGLLAALGGALLLAGLLVADRLGRRLVRAAQELAGTSRRLTAGDLAARATGSGPAELRQAGTGLNRLAVRISELLDEERREAADLAHRLRTPVTSLRLEAETLRDPQERSRLTEAAHRVTRAVDELIRTAGRPFREGVAARADLTAVVAERLAFWQALAEESGRIVHRDLAEGAVPVRLAPADVATLVDVLLDNVFTHTPHGATVRVTVRGSDGARLVVEDAGPGFAVADAAVGTGLGLDIARRTAANSGGRLVVGRGDLGGARVEVELGSA